MLTSLNLFAMLLLTQSEALLTVCCQNLTLSSLPTRISRAFSTQQLLSRSVPSCISARASPSPGSGFAFILTEFCEVPVSLLLQPAWVPLNGTTPPAISCYLPASQKVAFSK